MVGLRACRTEEARSGLRATAIHAVGAGIGAGNPMALFVGSVHLRPVDSSSVATGSHIWSFISDKRGTLRIVWGLRRLLILLGREDRNPFSLDASPKLEISI